MNTVLEQGSQFALSVSVVTYYPDVDLLKRTFSSLIASFELLRAKLSERTSLKIVIVDNGGGVPEAPLDLLRKYSRVEVVVITGHGNVGYGAGHNLAIERIDSEAHLVLNPDVALELDALCVAHSFLERNAQYGLLAPHVANDRGHTEHLCRRYPTVLTLFVRGFLPTLLRGPFRLRLERYELRDQIDTTGNVVDKSIKIFEPEIISGCFMFFRTEVLRKANGFDPSYFLYFEDYDLSLRVRKISKIAYVPDIRIIHSGGGAARKGSTHVRMFVVSAMRFFGRFGWRLW